MNSTSPPMDITDTTLTTARADLNQNLHDAATQAASLDTGLMGFSDSLRLHPLPTGHSATSPGSPLSNLKPSLRSSSSARTMGLFTRG